MLKPHEVMSLLLNIRIWKVKVTDHLKILEPDSIHLERLNKTTEDAIQEPSFSQDKKHYW
jgi:hypothetical protein